MYLLRFWTLSIVGENYTLWYWVECQTSGSLRSLDYLRTQTRGPFSESNPWGVSLLSTSTTIHFSHFDFIYLTFEDKKKKLYEKSFS